MNIFLLSVSRLARECFDAVNPIRQLPLILRGDLKVYVDFILGDDF